MNNQTRRQCEKMTALCPFPNNRAGSWSITQRPVDLRAKVLGYSSSVSMLVLELWRCLPDRSSLVLGNGVGSLIISLALHTHLPEQWSEDMPRSQPEFKAHQLKGDILYPKG